MDNMQKHYIEAKKAEITTKSIKNKINDVALESQKFYGRLISKINNDNFGLGDNASPIALMSKVREYFANNQDMFEALRDLSADMHLLLDDDED